MGRLGERLRSEREARGIELEDLSAQTCLSVYLLSAIEREDFDKLPGGIFNVAFVRQYAHYVGLDEDEVVAEFNRIARPDELKLIERANDPDRGTAATFTERLSEFLHRYQVTAPVGLTAVLALVAVGVIAGQWDWENGFSSVTDLLPGPPESGTVQAPVETPSMVANRPPTPPPAPPKPVQVLLKISDTVWIRASSDGKRVFQRTFRAGESRAIEANESVRLLVGNAGAISVELNGEPMPRFGDRGQVRRILLTLSGMVIVPPPQQPGDGRPSTPVRARNEASPVGSAEPVLAGVRSAN